MSYVKCAHGVSMLQQCAKCDSMHDMKPVRAVPCDPETWRAKK